MPSLAGLSLSAPTSVRWCRVDRRLEQLSLDGLFHRGDGSTHPRIFDKLDAIAKRVAAFESLDPWNADAAKSLDLV